MQIKIVLCGGPCGGKTTSLHKLKSHNDLKKFDIITIEETATFLFSLGYAPNENISPFDFQNLLMKLQYIKEYEAEKKETGDRKIIICDRGIIDGIVYVNEENFRSLLQKNSLDLEKLLKTYDFAFYLQSISKSNPSLFQKLRIYETVETGTIRDEKSYEIWKKAEKMIISSPKEDLDEKIEYAIKIISEKYENYSSNSHKLHDFYCDEHLDFIKSSAINLVKENPPAFKEKQKMLLKELSKEVVK